MIDFTKHSGTNILLDTSDFSGGSGILDEESLNTQKAFKDINERLQIVDDVYDGLMSSEDKVKLDNLSSTDILYKESFIATDKQTQFLLQENIFNMILYIDGLLILDDNYYFTDNILTTLEIEEGSEVVIYYSTFVNSLNYIDDTKATKSTTWSSDKLNNALWSSVKKDVFIGTSGQTDFVLDRNIENPVVYIDGLMTQDFIVVDNTVLLPNDTFNKEIVIFSTNLVTNKAPINESKYFVSTQGQTDFRINEGSGTFDLTVFREGVLMHESEYTISNNTVIFNEPTIEGEGIYIQAFSVFATIDVKGIKSYTKGDVDYMISDLESINEDQNTLINQLNLDLVDKVSVDDVYNKTQVDNLIENKVESTDISNIVVVTESEYNLLTKNPLTLYIIK